MFVNYGICIYGVCARVRALYIFVYIKVCSKQKYKDTQLLGARLVLLQTRDNLSFVPITCQNHIKSKINIKVKYFHLARCVTCHRHLFSCRTYAFVFSHDTVRKLITKYCIPNYYKYSLNSIVVENTNSITSTVIL